ncbi:type II secretion system F family protein [Natranaerobius thermophilus]|uniref:type II secretion system F family protein n=1 Tax=Natranaerobius thermophilus TaxID=375929 RepID=UPI0001665557|nr:type II secretion system F family protein [Natranaerobius thermophilus]
MKGESFMLYTVLIFLFVFLLYYHIYLVVSKPKRDLKKRLEAYTQDSSRDAIDELETGPIRPTERNLRLNLRDLGRFLTRIDRLKGFREHLDDELIKSGILLRGEEFIVIMLLSGFTLGATTLVLGFSVILSVLAVIIGVYVPLLLLRMKKQNRQKQFNEQLGEVLTTMANAIRSGHSLLKAMETVARDTATPASDEFSYAVKEMQLGISTNEALNNMVDRVDSEDLELVVTAILIQRQVGGNLAEVLLQILSGIG